MSVKIEEIYCDKEFTVKLDGRTVIILCPSEDEAKGVAAGIALARKLAKAGYKLERPHVSPLQGSEKTKNDKV